MRRRRLKATAAFCLTGGLTFTSKMIARMRDKSNKERLNTKERAPLTVLRKISSGMGLSTISGSDGSLGISIGSLGIIMIDYATDENSHLDRWLDGVVAVIKIVEEWDDGGEDEGKLPLGHDPHTFRDDR